MMLEDHREQASAKSFAISRNRILLLDFRHARIEQCGNLAPANFNPFAAFRHVLNIETLRNFDVTLKLSINNFSILGDQSIRDSTHRRHDDDNRRTLLFTHDLNGALKCGCIADGGSAELEYPHKLQRKLKLNW